LILRVIFKLREVGRNNEDDEGLKRVWQHNYHKVCVHFLRQVKLVRKLPSFFVRVSKIITFWNGGDN